MSVSSPIPRTEVVWWPERPWFTVQTDDGVRYDKLWFMPSWEWLAATDMDCFYWSTPTVNASCSIYRLSDPPCTPGDAQGAQEPGRKVFYSGE